MAYLTHVQKPPQISSKLSQKDEAVEQVKHFIRSHQLKSGEKLPTVRELSDHFNLSRDSVWRALRQLTEEEWLGALPSRRYVISDKVYTQILTSLKVKAVFAGQRYIYFTGFRRLADALSRECRYHNLDLHIHLNPLRAKPDNSIFDGCDILLVDSDSSRHFLETFDSFPVPVIGLDANYSDRYAANIVTDHYRGGQMVAETFLTRQYEKATLVYFNGSADNPRVSSRIEGFRHSWFEGGREVGTLQVVALGWSESAFEVSLNVLEYLKNNPPGGPIFVTDGRLASAFLEVLSYLKVSVPEMVQLIGYDGAQKGELTDPPMTTVQQDMETIAQRAVSRIQSVANGENGTNILERVTPTLVQRDSF